MILLPTILLGGDRLSLGSWLEPPFRLDRLVELHLSVEGVIDSARRVDPPPDIA